MTVRPIDANIAMKKIREYMEDFPNATTRLAACRAILSMLGDKNQIPTLTPQNEWVSVEERLPTLPDSDYCSVMVNTAYKDNPKSRPMIYERSVVRGKRVERWKYYWDRIADEPPDYWMPLPAPPDKEQTT